MYYLALILFSVILFLVLELGYSRMKLNNKKEKERYMQALSYTQGLEQELAQLKLYRHDLDRYIRVLEKMAENQDDKAMAEYMGLLHRENRIVQELESELGDTIRENGREAVL